MEIKAAVVAKQGAPIQVQTLQLDAPKANEVLIKTVACGVCHSDSVVGAGMFGPLPRIPGHEVIGDIVAVGSEVKTLKVGDRVGGPWHGKHNHTLGQPIMLTRRLGGHDGMLTACRVWRAAN